MNKWFLQSFSSFPSRTSQEEITDVALKVLKESAGVEELGSSFTLWLDLKETLSLK